MAVPSSCSYRSKSQICLPRDLTQMGGCHCLSSILSNHTYCSCWSAVWQMTVGWHIKQMFLRDAWLSKLPHTPAGTWCGPNIVVRKPLTLWFCVQGRHSQSFQWQNVTKKLQRSPLTQSYLKKLMSNTVFRPQCNKSPIARHTTSSRDCRAAVQSCPHHYVRSHYWRLGWGPRGWFFLPLNFPFTSSVLPILDFSLCWTQTFRNLQLKVDKFIK